MGRDPVRVLPVPFSIGTANELFEIGAPRGEADVTLGGGRRVDWDGEVVVLDDGRRVGQLELDKLLAVGTEKLAEAVAGVRKVGVDDRDVLDGRQVPAGQDGEGGVVQAYFEGAERREAEW